MSVFRNLVKNVVFSSKNFDAKCIILVSPVLQNLEKKQGIVIFSSRVFYAVVFYMAFLTPSVVNEEPVFFQTLSSENDGVCVASGTKPLVELSRAPGVFCMRHKCSGFRLPQNNSETSQFLTI